jgi:gamma-tubulin complex component 5
MNIIQRSSIPIYQQVFTFLLQLYRAKYLLQSITLHDVRQSSNTAMRQLSYKLRHRLVWLVDILRSYVTETVIALSTQEMLAAMSKAEDIDEMSTIHLKYLARLQEQSLLAENLKPIHRAIISLLDLAAVFHDSVSEALRLNPLTKQDGKAHPKTNAKISSKKSTRRKSVIPTVVEDSGSDSASGSEEDNERPPDHAEKSVSVERSTPFASLKKVEQEFERLLPFVTAGLRNIGRVGAEPVWEMLAERLEWDRKDGG